MTVRKDILASKLHRKVPLSEANSAISEALRGAYVDDFASSSVGDASSW